MTSPPATLASLALSVWLCACGSGSGGDVDAGRADAGDAPRDAGSLADAGPRPPGVDAGPGGGSDAGAPGDGCGGDVGRGDRTLSVEHGGLTRTFVVHLPPSYDARTPTPVVLDFHGRNSTSMQQTFVSGMNALADAEGFVSVHPDGVGGTWNAGLCCPEAMSRGIDDVGFVAAMLDALDAELCIDEARVYATGLSNGGFMSHRLACDLADRIAAIAPVAGTNVTSSCSPGRAVPVLHFHGDADAVVPYDGFGGAASVASTMSAWATRNGCGASSAVVLERGDVTCEEWSGCRDGATVRLCTIAGGGHQWPGGFTIPGFGHNTSDISATEEMWAFFRMHALR